MMVQGRLRMVVRRSTAGHLIGALALLSGVLAAVPALAQSAPPASGSQAVRPLDAETFVRLAHSSAVIQGRAAELAASRETRPEAKAFAQQMVEFRRDQIPKLEAAARDNKVTVPSMPALEHRLILENLEPLDYLALTRRYAEFQVQALEQETQIYAGAAQSPDSWVQTLAAETAPVIERHLEGARAMMEKVGP